MGDDISTDALMVHIANLTAGQTATLAALERIAEKVDRLSDDVHTGAVSDAEVSVRLGIMERDLDNVAEHGRSRDAKIGALEEFRLHTKWRLALIAAGSGLIGGFSPEAIQSLIGGGA